MKNWIKTEHSIYFLSFVLFVVSLVSTSKWTTPNKQTPIQFTKPTYQLEIVRYPFSLSLKTSDGKVLALKKINLRDQNNHTLPLDYLIEPEKKHGRTYASDTGYNKDSYSYIISSHMKKGLKYRVSFKTKADGIVVGLFPINNATKNFSKDKKLNLIIQNKDIFENHEKSILTTNSNFFFDSQFFTLKKIQDKFSQLKVNQNFNKLKLSSANSEIFFALNIKNNILSKSNQKVTYQTKNLK